MRTIPFILLLLTTIHISGQTVDWARKIGGLEHDHCAIVTVDNDGNIIAAGTFQSMVDLDPGPGTILVNGGTQARCYIQKFDPSGDLIWAGSFGSDWADKVRSVLVDAGNNIIVIGDFSGTESDFDPGPGVHPLHMPFSAGHMGQIFVIKLDQNMQLLWARSIGGAAHDLAYAGTLDPAGNIYVGGTFQGTADLDPGPGTLEFVSAGLSDACLVKLDPSGELLWANVLGGPGWDGVFSLATDPAGNVFVRGKFSGTVDMDPGPGVHELTSTAVATFSDPDVFLSKFDPQGQFLWARAFDLRTAHGTNLTEHLLRVDGMGNIRMGGVFRETTDLDPGPGVFEVTLPEGATVNGFVSKWDADGNFIDAIVFTGSHHMEIVAIAIDDLGGMALTGYFRDSIDVDPGPGVQWLTSDGALADMFLIRLNSSDGLEWGIKMGGTENDQGSSVVFNGAANIFLGGFFRQTIDLGMAGSFTSLGMTDAILMKFVDNNVITGLGTSDTQVEWWVFPNPLTDQATIGFNMLEDARVTLEIFNSMGQRSGMPVNSFVPSGHRTLSIDTGHLPAGIHFLHVMIDDRRMIRKIVKQ